MMVSVYGTTTGRGISGRRAKVGSRMWLFWRRVLGIPGQPARRPFTPQLEGMEQRCVPSAVAGHDLATPSASVSAAAPAQHVHTGIRGVALLGPIAPV